MTLQWINKPFSSGMKQVCHCQWGDGVKHAEVRKIPLFQAEDNLQINFLGGFVLFFFIFLNVLAFILCLEYLF